MEKEKPEGVNWLYNQKTLQLYRSLLGSSQKEATLEACCGALQNLTASKSSVCTLTGNTHAAELQGKSFNLYFDLCAVVHTDESKHREAEWPACHFAPADIRKPRPTEDRHVLSGQHVPGVISAGSYG